MDKPPPTRPLRWVSWAAVSSQPQATPDKISIPLQLEQNRLAAEKHGGEIVAELVIPGESRSIDTWEEACERIDAYAQLAELLNARAFDVLVYYDASRLARTASVGFTIRQLCLRRKIALYPTTSPPAELVSRWRHDQAVVDAFQSIGAQDEVAKLVERKRVGMVGKIKRGEMPTKAPYGYRRVFDPDGAKRIVIDETQAAAVRAIFRHFVEGMPYQTIANRLNDMGSLPPRRAGGWDNIAVYNITLNVWVYAGYAEFNRRSVHGDPYVRARGQWVPILDEETVKAAELEREQRAINRNIVHAPHRLSSICRCASCGGTLTVTVHGWHAHQEGGNPARIYEYVRCVAHTPVVQVRSDAVIAYIDKEIRALAHADLYALANSAADPLEDLRIEATESEAAAARLAQSMRRADDAYVAGLMDEERYREQVERLRAQADATRRQIEALYTQMADIEEAGPRLQRLTDVRDNGLTRLHNPDKAAANRWLRHHVMVICSHRKIEAVVFR